MIPRRAVKPHLMMTDNNRKVKGKHMRLILIEANPGAGWDITVWSETTPLVEQRGVLVSCTGTEVAAAFRAADPHAMIVVAEITAADIENAAQGIFRKSEHHESEADQRAHDARTVDV